MERSNLSVGSLIRQYGLVAFFGLVGILFISIGLFQTFSSPKEEILFDDANDVEIFVDVSGAVINPGVYPLSSLSRMKDAVIVAGGMSVDADREYLAKNVNMARVLEDGEKIYIPFEGELDEELESEELVEEAGVVMSGLEVSSGGLVNLNTATESELDELPGVGPVTVGKIMNGRPYKSVEELLSKKVLGPGTYEKVKELVSVQ